MFSEITAPSKCHESQSGSLRGVQADKKDVSEINGKILPSPYRFLPCTTSTHRLKLLPLNVFGRYHPQDTTLAAINTARETKKL